MTLCYHNFAMICLQLIIQYEGDGFQLLPIIILKNTFTDHFLKLRMLAGAGNGCSKSKKNLPTRHPVSKPLAQKILLFMGAIYFSFHGH